MYQGSPARLVQQLAQLVIAGDPVADKGSEGLTVQNWEFPELPR